MRKLSAGLGGVVCCLMVSSLWAGGCEENICEVSSHCDDDDPCTVDSCEDSDNSSKRYCAHEPIPGCPGGGGGGQGAGADGGGGGTISDGGAGGFIADGGGGATGDFQCADLMAACPAPDPEACACYGCEAAACGDSDCNCAVCDEDAYCNDPQNCTDDGLCNPYNEGCICADCLLHPDCD